jgi:hypothetical protein
MADLTDMGGLQRAFLLGWPWDGLPHDVALEKCWAGVDAGLLKLVRTKPGSNDEYEFGETMFVLTEAGRLHLAEGEET